ncbi:MAG: hypothetical protein ACYCV7_09360, partial [Acidimicrobiales bacterium]
RRGGRFEIRESVHTPKGSRARSLASFSLLTEEVCLATLEQHQQMARWSRIVDCGPVKIPVMAVDTDIDEAETRH